MEISLNTLKAIKYKGFRIPTPIQRKTMPLLLDRMDVVAMARTGSGKTAAFVIPMIERLKTHHAKVGSRALILCPNRELAIQTIKVVKELKRGTNLRSVLLVGGESLEEQFEMMEMNPDIIVATPGRFLHLKVEMDLDLKTIEYVVFDEADRLFEMGFSEQLSEILRYLPTSRQTSLFSATLPRSLVDFAKAGLQNPILVRLDTELVVSEDLQSAFFSIKPSEKEAALLYLLHDIIKVPKTIEEAGDGNLGKNDKNNTYKHNQNAISPYSTIIFTCTRHHVEYLEKLLSLYGYSVSYIYGSLDQVARRNQIASFRAGKTTLLVVTDIAARGIDIPLLSNVINYDFPSKPKIYVHRVGRTARAGQKGWAYSLVRAEDAAYLIELQLFLGRKIVSSNSQDPDYVQNIVLGTFPRQNLEYYCEWIAQLLRENSECYSLKKVMHKGEILYSKTAGSASIESNRRAKELVKGVEWSIINPLLVDSNCEKNTEKEALMAKISSYSPHGTIFEGSRSFKSGIALKEIDKRMKKIRTSRVKANKSDPIEQIFHGKKRSKTNNDTIANINDFGENNTEIRSGIIDENRAKNEGNSYKDKENYMAYYTPASSTREHAYDVSKSNYSFERATKNAIFDLMGNDNDLTDQTEAHRNKIHWSFKKKKLVSRTNDYNNSKGGSKIIKDEGGIKIPATYKTGRYTTWKNSRNIIKKKVGEIESCENLTAPKSLNTNINKGKYKHNKLQAPKPADKYCDDYKKRKKRIQKALEKGYGDNKRVKSELRNIMEIRKIRRLKEKRRQKNARPSKKKH
ncbi:hypothetical protein T552_04152 [Pneumocystis carinii B80]|uniref:RNA helicase n=1 Tax=Pneumocystis carinii (strain B80) TaxID=1408658 RepID=A0A0W4ZG34_PNEC8|nr:hypothetical protein T552_04152 [Pneumocystis carinii B80]KTW27330.1 hypothetical protein T552_04152 [Pneumocystis carinii B80]